jgi:hypothetical protein
MGCIYGSSAQADLYDAGRRTIGFVRKRALFMRHQMPSLLLIVGIASFLAGIVWTYTGRASVRFHGWVYRAKEPGWFWWEVALYYLCGVALVIYYLYLIDWL